MPGRLTWRLSPILVLAPIAAAGQAPQETGEPRLTEAVIVTARKVEEDAFGVPMSIQVVPRSDIDATDPTDLYDIQFDVPGLVVASTGMNGAGISLRGVTAEAGRDLAIAPHFNGVYLGRSMLALQHQFDMERIEVIKGPQGTLYGRNAPGGTINLVSRAPQDEFSSGLESAIGSFNTVRIEGYVNFAADRIAVRLAGTGSEGDGFIRNSVDTRTFAEEDYAAFRASVRARPTNALTLNLTAQHMVDDGGSGELWLPNRDNLLDPDDIRLTTVTLDNPYLHVEHDIVSVDIAQDFDAGTLTSVTGYVRSETRGVDDCSHVPARPCVRSYLPHAYEQRSEEIRFASAPGKRHDWLVGLFFLDTDELANFTLVRASPVPSTDYSEARAESAAALFGQTVFRFTERMSFTAGLRASYETNELTRTDSVAGGSMLPADFRDDWDNTSWRIGLDYMPSGHLLYYGSIATGFKSGGVSGRLPTGEFDAFDPEDLTAYEAGAKFRSPGQRWTLQGSAFLYDFKNLQVVTTSSISGASGTIFSVENATDARIQGIDVSADIRIGDRLRFSGGLVWMPTREFVDFTSAQTGDVLSGNVLSRAPELQSSVSIAYERSIKAAGALVLRATYAGRSEFFFTKENALAASQEAFGLLNLFAQFESAQHWYVFASARNVLDTDYFTQAFIQSSPGRPANYELGFGMRF